MSFRRPCLILSVVLVAILMAGCEDQHGKAVHEQFVSRLAAMQRGQSFPMRDLVAGKWTTMWFFGGYTTPEDMEKVVGRRWDGAHEVAEGAYVTVILGPGDLVRGFEWTGPPGVLTMCLPRKPVKPADRFWLIGPVEGEGPDSNYLARVENPPKQLHECSPSDEA